MNGTDVYNILRDNGVYILHHANTVTTSCTYLRMGGLASRGYVEERNLPQTPQYSDHADKRLGIWYDIFLDGIDIHERGRIRNNYGPVLSKLPTTILLNLPPGVDVRVTRKNPVRWQSGETDSEHYFLSPQELRAGYQYGDFGQHIILQTKDGFLPFPAGTELSILLDDPQRAFSGGVDAYTSAVQRLESSARDGGLVVNISKRNCRLGCQCLSGHKLSYDITDVEFWF